MKTKRLREEAERLCLDRISTLPQPILETILCLLRTREAVRTSILSREWRYKWTTIPKLKLSHNKQPVSEQTSDMRCKPCYDIHQILLLHQGPIHEFSLILPEDDCLELDQIILHLSRNHTVNKLAFTGWGFNFRWYKLPISVFSFHHLTDLYLCSVDLDHHPPTFSGFGSLRRLRMRFVRISTKTLLHLLSTCPSLKSWSLYRGGPSDLDDKCTINELFECLPMIEHLTIWPRVSRWLVLDSVPKELPTSLIHLKYFCFEEMGYYDAYGLCFLLVLIKCSPNLEKIKLENDKYYQGDEEDSVIWKVYSDDVWKDYSDVWLKHLNELEIEYFKNTKPEMEFVKFILARSPKLKKVSIISDVYRNEESNMLKTLLQAPRVSPAVINVMWD